MLAIAKRDTVDRLHSKALAENQIRDGEFQLIMTEFLQYNVLKDAVRAKPLASGLSQMLRGSEKTFAARWRQIFEKKYLLSPPVRNNI